MSAPGADRDAERRRRRAADLILDDEALRGGLDDSTAEPVISWLLGAADAAAGGTAGAADAEDMDARVARLKSHARALTQLLERWSDLSPSARTTALGRLASDIPASGLGERAADLAHMADAAEAAVQIVAALPAHPA